MTVYSRSHPISCRRLSPTQTTLLHVYVTVCFMTKSSHMIVSLHLRLLSQCRRCCQQSSIAATSQDDQQDIEPDDDADDDHRSQNTSAASMIRNQQIALDMRLAIFTVNDTSEPRVVHLFRTTTCSSPAKSNCYHILAARMAVGINGDGSKLAVNLTQLRKNTRKRPDKTCHVTVRIWTMSRWWPPVTLMTR